MNDFVPDDLYQRQKRDQILKPKLYDRWWHGLYHFCDDAADMDYQKRGIDTVVSTMQGVVTIEEKIVRNTYDAFALETRSCTVPGYEKPGWMFYCEAARLLYCFPLGSAGLECWWMDMPALQAWFWPIETSFRPFQMSSKNMTSGRVVPIATIINAKIPIMKFKL